MELVIEVIEVLLNNRPTFFEKLCIESIWPRRFVVRKILDH
jgi:hypothetical protein